MIPEKFLFVLSWIAKDDRIVSTSLAFVNHLLAPIIFQTHHTSTCKWHERISGAGGGVVRNACPSSRSNFFQFHAVFGENGQNNRLGLAPLPPSRKSWIHHCECRIVYLLLIAVHEACDAASHS